MGTFKIVAGCWVPHPGQTAVINVLTAYYYKNKAIILNDPNPIANFVKKFIITFNAPD